VAQLKVSPEKTREERTAVLKHSTAANRLWFKYSQSSSASNENITDGFPREVIDEVQAAIALRVDWLAPVLPQQTAPVEAPFDLAGSSEKVYFSEFFILPNPIYRSSRQNVRLGRVFADLTVKGHYLCVIHLLFSSI
jgi:hypothetical protein